MIFKQIKKYTKDMESLADEFKEMSENYEDKK